MVDDGPKSLDASFGHPDSLTEGLFHRSRVGSPNPQNRGVSVARISASILSGFFSFREGDFVAQTRQAVFTSIDNLPDRSRDSAPGSG